MSGAPCSAARRRADGPAVGPRPIDLEFVAHAEILLGEIVDIGPVLSGHRRVIPITGGHFAGPLLDATILSGGADWQLVASDGTAVIDTRYTARTAGGALIYVSTSGFRCGPADVIARLAKGDVVPPEEYTFRLTVRLECGSPECSWMNHTVFVATAARQARSVTYDLYALR
jgi:5-methylphenazine-1-carboxylate 1-monooxygenase